MDKVNVHIRSLTIELTRWCQNQCLHCMRGPRECIFISNDVIDSFFEKHDYNIKYIDELILTGGEPTIATKQLEYLINKIKDLGIEVCRYLVLTNGIVYNKTFFNQLKRLNSLNGRKNGNIEISTDQFHPKPSTKVIQEFDDNGIDYKEEYITSILNSGLAKVNGLGTYERDFCELNLKPIYGLYVYYDKVKKITVMTDDEIPVHHYYEIDAEDDCICVFPETVSKSSLEKYLILDRVILNSKGFILRQGDGEFSISDKFNLGNTFNTSLLDIYQELSLDFEEVYIKNLILSTIKESGEVKSIKELRKLPNYKISNYCFMKK